jgi:hypothetical protein
MSSRRLGPVLGGILAVLATSGLADAQMLQVPFRFEENRGQYSTRAKYVGLASGYRTEMRPDEVMIHGGGLVHMRFGNGRKDPAIQPSDRMAAATDVYDGRGGRFFRQLRNYRALTYSGVYPGIDVVFHGSGQALEFDVVLEPYADYRAVVLDFSGQTDLTVANDGTLILQMSRGEMRLLPPAVYQEVHGKRKVIPAHYARLDNNRIRFDLADYDPAKPTVIDPRLVFAGYAGPMGGNLSNVPSKLVVGANGSAYAVWTEYDAQDNFETRMTVVRFDGDQPAYFYTTGYPHSNSAYIEDPGLAMAVDKAGNPAVLTHVYYGCGGCPALWSPSESLLPHGNPAQDADISIIKWGPNAFSTNLGGHGDDFGAAIAFDSQNNIFITGYTNSADFPTVHAFQSQPAGGWDGFLTEINATGTQVLYSTYLGGKQNDLPSAVALDSSGNIYVAGTTASANFPTANAMQGSNAGGSCVDSTGATGPCTDMFVAKFNPAGTALLYSTYIGGSGGDSAAHMAVTPNGSVFLHGSGGPNFPTASSLGFTAATADVLVELDASGSHLNYSMRFPSVRGIAADNAGNLYVTGNSVTEANNLPLPVINSNRLNPVAQDIAVSEFDPKGNLIFSTLIGGTADYYYNCTACGIEYGEGIGVNAAGRIFVIGATYTSDFPVTDGSSAVYYLKSDHDAVIFALDPSSGSDTSPRYSRIENNYPQIHYSGNWYSHSSQYDSGGSSALAQDAGSSFTVNFTGTAVNWFGCRDEWSGIAKVLLDGVVQGDIDTYMTPGQCPSLIWSASGLNSGAHTFVVQPEGRKNPASAENWVWLDKIEIASAGDASFVAPNSGGTSGGSNTSSGNGTSTGTSGNNAVGSSVGANSSTFRRVEQTDPSFSYRGNWFTIKDPVLSGGSAAAAVDAGSSVTFTFTGTTARWIGYKDPWSGIAKVYIDGVFQMNVDTYDPGEQEQVIVYTTPTLSAGTHQITILITDTHSVPSQTESWIWIDAFEIIGGSSSTKGGDSGVFTRVEQTDPSVTYNGHWYTLTNGVLSGGTSVEALDPRSTATFTFNGTIARWIGFKDPWSGIARVYIDGVLQTTVDTYDPGQQSQAVVYTTPTLTASKHTLTIEVTGTHGGSGQSSWIWIDAFEFASGTSGGSGGL